MLSMEEKKENKFVVNLNDEAVRSMLITHEGKRLDPYKPPVVAGESFCFIGSI